MTRKLIPSLLAAVLAATVPASAIERIFSLDLVQGDAYYTARTTATGELLVVNTNALRATRMNHGVPAASATFAAGGSIDAKWFDAQKNLQSFVLYTKSGTQRTYALYRPVAAGAAAPLGSFGNIGTGVVSVAYYRGIAGMVEETYRGAILTTNLVRTFRSKFREKVNASIKAVFASTPTNTPIVSLMDKITVRAENSKDPVAGSTLYKYYTTRGSGLVNGSAPASKKLGLTVVYSAGSLYLYDQDNKKTLAGPMAVPGIATNETISGNWATSTNTIVLRVQTSANVALRKYAVAAAARQTYESKPFNSQSTCNLYNKSRFLLVETNGTGSVVNKISANTLQTTGSQTCSSKNIVASTDRYFIDDYTAIGVRKVDVYGF